MKNGCVLLSVYIIILLSSVELRADEINNVYKTVQQLPIEQCDENCNLWDFRDVVITGDSRIRIRNFGDSIIDRTSILERNDFSRNGDSIFIIGFENYKYDLSCDSPQYLFNISDDGTRKTSYNLTGKAFRQYPVYLSGEVEIERSNQGAILMPAGDTIRNVDCMRQVFPQEKNVVNEASYLDEIKGCDYICYEFGLSRIITIIVIKETENYKVLIPDCCVRKIIETTAYDSSILDWAFNRMSVELKNSDYIIDDSYKPYYYKLSYITKNQKVLATITSMESFGEIGFVYNLDKLRTYLVELWIGNCM
ncbi:MAG: hypothetical protein K2L77_09695 [Muribaculaceae bacterium]|nr:hypothetical protein [Muribaculaceae bacterium]